VNEEGIPESVTETWIVSAEPQTLHGVVEILWLMLMAAEVSADQRPSAHSLSALFFLDSP